MGWNDCYHGYFNSSLISILVPQIVSESCMCAAGGGSSLRLQRDGADQAQQLCSRPGRVEERQPGSLLCSACCQALEVRDGSAAEAVPRRPVGLLLRRCAMLTYLARIQLFCFQTLCCLIANCASSQVHGWSQVHCCSQVHGWGQAVHQQPV